MPNNVEQVNKQLMKLIFLQVYNRFQYSHKTYHLVIKYINLHSCKLSLPLPCVLKHLASTSGKCQQLAIDLYNRCHNSLGKKQTHTRRVVNNTSFGFGPRSFEAERYRPLVLPFSAPNARPSFSRICCTMLSASSCTSRASLSE